jgi:hypothetical protein
MATSMDTFVSIRKGNKEVAEKLKELLDTDTPNQLVNNLFDTDYNDDNYPTVEWMIDNVGAKWIQCEFNYDDDPQHCHIQFETAYSVPQGFLKRLAEELSKIKEDCYIVGDYEDESPEVIGAFVYAHDYDDIEDDDSIEVADILDKLIEDDTIEDIDFNGDTIEFDGGYDWFSGSPNGREKMHNLQSELKKSLEDAYLECLEEN